MASQSVYLGAVWRGGELHGSAGALGVAARLLVAGLLTLAGGGGSRLLAGGGRHLQHHHPTAGAGGQQSCKHNMSVSYWPVETSVLVRDDFSDIFYFNSILHQNFSIRKTADSCSEPGAFHSTPPPPHGAIRFQEQQHTLFLLQ